MTECAACRVRHLSCDTKCPCQHCEIAGRECVALNIRFRNLVCPSDKISRAESSKYEFFFDRGQRWVEGWRRVVFVDEGVDGDGGDKGDDGDDGAVVKGDGGEEGGDLVEELGDGRGEVDKGRVRWDFASVEGIDSKSRDERASWLPDTQLITSYDEPPDYLIAVEQGRQDYPRNQPRGTTPNDPRESYQLKGILHAYTGFSSHGAVPNNPGIELPLKSLQQTKLFQHFIIHLAPWFDVGDSNRYFGKVAARMAAKSPLLMTAILAIAALHENRISGRNDMYDAMTLHDKCLSMIVPMLSDPKGADDDNVLMTTTILHLYDGLESGNDLPRHLKGTSIFFPANSTSNSSPLRRAVFWLHLRQEIYNAYLYQRPVDTDLSNCSFDSSNESDDDDMWFHQTLYMAAHVTKWAFGKDSSHTRWKALHNMFDEWEHNRPAHFNPIHFRARSPQDGNYFPEISHATDEHVAAAHFFYLAKLLLITHDPTLPRIGPLMKSATIAMQNAALAHVRILIGIAVCNPWVPARFTANLAIVICQAWFEERREQEALILFVRETRRCTGWARDEVERGLVEAWRWEER